MSPKTVGEHLAIPLEGLLQEIGVNSPSQIWRKEVGFQKSVSCSVCPPHLGKIVTGVWFHVDFLLPIHVSYWKLILPSFESPATGLLPHVLRNHFQKVLGGNQLAEILALAYRWDRGAVCRTQHTLFCELSSCAPIQLVLVTGFAKSY